MLEAVRMMEKIFCFLFCCFFSVFAYGTEVLFEGAGVHDSTPYMLPLSHPLKPILDRIFCSGTVLDDEEHVAQAGFIVLQTRPRNPIRIALHPAVDGYLFKLFLNSEVPSYQRPLLQEGFIRRCIAAEIIRNLIHTHSMRYFSVPDKWLYETPVSPTTGKSSLVLVVTKMNILSHSKNRQAWHRNVNSRVLKELFILLNRSPISQRFLSNLPYTEEGKFSFIDTERHNCSLKKISRFLSKRMQKRWNHMLEGF